MPLFRSPAKLFAYTALSLFLLRILFPPATNSPQLHSYVRFFDVQLDITGYGFFEFAALVFALSALTYYLIARLTGGTPNVVIVQLHFWPSFLFAVSFVYIAYWANRIPSEEVAATQVRGRNWLAAFNWAFVAFLLFQIVFAFAAIRNIVRHKKAIPST